MSITPEQVRQFEEDGFLIVDQILSDAQAQRALAAVERIFRGECRHDRRPPEFRRPIAQRSQEATTNHGVNGRLFDDDLWQISTDARIGEMAARLLRTRSVSLMEDQMIQKFPGGPPVAMHQDAPYLPFLRSWDVINLWIALTDVTEESAPLLCIPGSQRWPVSAQPRRFSNGGEEDLMEVVEAARPPGARGEPVAAVIPAGSGVFFGALTMHGSHRNSSDRMRYAYTLHFAAEECRANIQHWPPNYEDYIKAGVQDGGRIVSDYMPVVYPVS